MICKKCEGSGRKVKALPLGGHQSRQCPCCKGSGEFDDPFYLARYLQERTTLGTDDDLLEEFKRRVSLEPTEDCNQ